LNEQHAKIDALVDELSATLSPEEADATIGNMQNAVKRMRLSALDAYIMVGDEGGDAILRAVDLALHAIGRLRLSTAHHGKEGRFDA